MSEKIVITGSNGLLGQKLVNLISADENFEVFAVSRGEDKNKTANNYFYIDLDITEKDKVITFLNKVKPQYIVNCAAMTNVDQCEREQEQCDRINIGAVKTLVEFCKESNVYLLHISTDFIFDGEDGPYKEEDRPNPLSHYGRSKLKSEELIRESEIRHTIIRTILVYGLVDSMSRTNIVLFIKESLENNKEITMVTDQYRMPTLVDDLAQACYSAIVKRAYGIFHISSSELLSIYDIALEVACVFDLDPSYIKKITTRELNQIAQRPYKTGFILDKAEKVLDFPVIPFKNGLKRFKNQHIKKSN